MRECTGEQIPKNGGGRPFSEREDGEDFKTRPLFDTMSSDQPLGRQHRWQHKTGNLIGGERALPYGKMRSPSGMSGTKRKRQCSAIASPPPSPPHVPSTAISAICIIRTHMGVRESLIRLGLPCTARENRYISQRKGNPPPDRNQMRPLVHCGLYRTIQNSVVVQITIRSISSSVGSSSVRSYSRVV